MFTRRPALTSLQYLKKKKKEEQIKDISTSRFLITVKIKFSSEIEK